MAEEGHRITEPMLVAAIADQLNDTSAEIKIKDFRVSEGSQKGDNFACVMKVSHNIYFGAVVLCTSLLLEFL